MATPSPLSPVKGDKTTLWIYAGTGDPYANPQSDVDWTRLAQIKELTPGELSAESYDDNYVDDEDSEWETTGQGVKSAGQASFTLAWKPGETGQKGLLSWFDGGEVKAYKIKYPNGTVDVFKGWVSNLGKTVARGEVITRTVQITNVGRPSLAEDTVAVVSVTGVTADPTSVNVAAGATTTVQLTISPDGASDKSFLVTSSDEAVATVTASGTVLTIAGVVDGTANIVVVTSDGKKVVIIPVTVS